MAGSDSLRAARTHSPAPGVPSWTFRIEFPRAGRVILPPRAILYRLVLTTAAMWFLVRLAGGALGIGLFSPPGTGVVCLLILGLIWVDIRAFREDLLFGNLAISRLAVSLVVLSVGLTLELVTGALLGEWIHRLIGG